MTQNEFNVVLEQQYRKCADVLAHKKKEYTGDRIDRLSAFKIAASLQGCTPKAALAGIWCEACTVCLHVTFGQIHELFIQRFTGFVYKIFKISCSCTHLFTDNSSTACLNDVV